MTKKKKIVFNINSPLVLQTLLKVRYTESAYIKVDKREYVRTYHEHEQFTVEQTQRGIQLVW